jgi:RND family efflux transporter MFP subunit
MTRGGPLFNVFLVIVGLVIGAGGIFYYMEYYGKEPILQGVVVEEKKEKKILYWRAPMDPTYISDEPGKSPMGMDLIPVYEGKEETMEPGTVRIDPVTVQNIGVKTEIVRRMVLKKTIRTVGRVDYDEKRLYHINTKIGGWVEKLYIDFTGQEVKEGGLLLEIYSPELVSTQEEYLLVYKAAKETSASPFEDVSKGMESLVRATRERLRYWDISDDQIRRLEETGKTTKTMRIHSPSGGIVVKKHVKEGMYVKPGMNLYTIGDISRIWVYADIYEYELGWIKTGQEAEITLLAYPGKVFNGRVSFIYPFMEPKTRTVKVRLEFDNKDRELKPDMYANVTIKSRIGKDSIAVPTEAVLLSGERSVVILARGDGKFSPRDVTLGAEAEGYYEVIKGLEEGEEVVISAHFLIDSESRLKEAITKMLEAKKGGAADNRKMDDMEGMDHSGMEGMKHEDMEGMKHGSEKMDDMEGMDHSGMEGMKHEDMEGMKHGSEKTDDMEGMDHSGMEGMKHEDMEGMKHGSEKMDGMEGMDHSGMEGMKHEDMEGMDHSSM